MVRVCVVALVCGLAAVAVAAAPLRPHLVFALADDLGWFGTTLNGNTEVHTPALQSLADKGIIFDDYYVYKFCSPSRASFLTGRVPGHGIWETNPQKTAAIGINLNITMLPGMLKKAGYATHQIGKWHQGMCAPQFLPHGRGFDTSLGFLLGGEDHFTQCASCANQIPSPDWSDHPIPCPSSYSPCHVLCPEQGGIDLWNTDHPMIGKNGTYNSYTFSAEAERIVREHPDPKTPLFIFLAMHDVHQPVEAPPSMLVEYPASQYNSTNVPRRVYNAMTSAVDSVVGNLTARGMWDNTVFVFSTDNGGTYEHHGIVPGSSNYPLRGHKYSYFEGGIRGTGFVASPLLPSSVTGKRSSAMLQICDWYPTFLGLAGVDPDDGFKAAPVDGVNVWPLLTGEATTRPASSWTGGPAEDEMIYGVGHGNAGALRQGKYKLIVGGQGSQTDGWSAQYPGTTPRVHPPSSEACKDHPCLFDVLADRRETNDLHSVLSNVTSAMLNRYHELASRMSVPNGHEEDLMRWVEMGGEDGAGGDDACTHVKETGFWGPWKTSP